MFGTDDTGTIYRAISQEVHAIKVSELPVAREFTLFLMESRPKEGFGGLVRDAHVVATVKYEVRDTPN